MGATGRRRCRAGRGRSATCSRSAQGRSLCPSTHRGARRAARVPRPASAAASDRSRTSRCPRSRSRACRRRPCRAAAGPSRWPPRSARPGTAASAPAVRRRARRASGRPAGPRCARRRPRRSRPGRPAGICTMESSESMPSRYFSGTGTPITGSGVTEASMPGRWAAPPAPGDDRAQSASGGLLAVREHLVRHAVRGDDVGLVGDLELLQRLGRLLHDRPVRVGAHDETDERGCLRRHSVIVPRRYPAAWAARSRTSAKSSP